AAGRVHGRDRPAPVRVARARPGDPAVPPRVGAGGAPRRRAPPTAGGGARGARRRRPPRPAGAGARHRRGQRAARLGVVPRRRAAVDAPPGRTENLRVETPSDVPEPEAYVPREPVPDGERYWLPSTRAVAIECARWARLPRYTGLAVDP